VPEKFRDIPVTLRLKAFTDQGVVWDHYTEQEAPNLANQYLFGYGVGVDVTSYYDFNFRLEYAFNDRSESDLFLHFGLPF
jgi:hemolysin activation/secretion protein